MATHVDVSLFWLCRALTIFKSQTLAVKIASCISRYEHISRAHLVLQRWSLVSVLYVNIKKCRPQNQSTEQVSF